MYRFHGLLNNPSETLEVLINGIQKYYKVIMYSQKMNLFRSLLNQWFPDSFSLRLLDMNRNVEAVNL
jgi:hypothetical protein